jgi:adenylate kinase family enzyme
MNKIAIIGIMGSGKSTFAKNLGDILGIEVIHLDKESWLPGWKEKYTKQEWELFQREITQRPQWIIDGNYQSTLDIRLSAADTIVYFDFPKIFSIYRVIKRSFFRGQPFDKAQGVKEKVSVNLIKFIMKFPKKKIKQMLGLYTSKKIIVLRNQKDVSELLKTISNL